MLLEENNKPIPAELWNNIGVLQHMLGRKEEAGMIL